jgi:hypothetical protein
MEKAFARIRVHSRLTPPRLLKPTPLLAQCRQIQFALALEINANRPRGRRTFSRQLLHPQIDVVNPSEHALDRCASSRYISTAP